MRAILGAFLALVFAVVVMPGTMAMPAPSHKMAMDAAMPAYHCDHMKLQKDQGTPCKGMKVCLGLLNCFGVAVVAAEQPAARLAAPVSHVPAFTAVAVGMTHPPDTPPPIL